MTCYRPVLLLFTLLINIATCLGNEWSNCSRSCSMGISHRVIPCQDTPCTNIQKEFRVCNQEVCSSDHVDFRSEQCQRYGKELVPFINASNPCKLICMSPVQKPTEKGIAIDGTPCLSGGVCVDGTCIPVGCNGILGSEEKIDRCGRCGSTNGICLRVPCTINHKLTTNEFITKLPAGSTRVTISWVPPCRISVLPHSANQFLISDKDIIIDGPLKKQITVKINCQERNSTVTCGYYIPLYEDITFIAQSVQKYQWIVGNGFTTCSQTCGIGVQISNIYCQKVATKRLVEVALCNGLPLQHLDILIRKCNMPPCPHEWKASDWSPCSKSCGGGHRSRNVTCVQMINSLTYVDSKNLTQCSHSKPKPRSREICNQHHCYTHWHTGPWSDCSTPCGNGTRKRNLTCINAHGMEIQTNSCKLLIKPKDEKKCIGKMCVYKWIKSDWSNCSVNCGKGYQTRNVHCQYVKEKRLVNDSSCSYSIKPTTLKQCQGCWCTGKWKVEEWGQCEAKKCNSKGLRLRNVFCVIMINGSVVSIFDYTKCDNFTEPPRTKGCYKTEGCKPRWVPLPWGQCHRSCNGIRIRGLVCMLGDELVDKAECPSGRPSIIAKCNVNAPCLMASCKPKSFCTFLAPYKSIQSVLTLCKEHCCDQCKSN